MKAKYKGPGYHYGIPKRDLSEEDWKRLTPAQRDIVVASPVYELVDEPKKDKKKGS